MKKTFLILLSLLLLNSCSKRNWPAIYYIEEDAEKKRIIAFGRLDNCEKLKYMEYLYNHHIRINGKSSLYMLYFMENKTKIKSSASVYGNSTVYKNDSQYLDDINKWRLFFNCYNAYGTIKNDKIPPFPIENTN